MVSRITIPMVGFDSLNIQVFGTWLEVILNADNIIYLCYEKKATHKGRLEYSI